MIMSDREVASYDGLIDDLSSRVPELREEIEAVRQTWAPEPPGQHIIYGDILNPYLVKLLETGADDQRLQEIFAFLEELAQNPDDHVREVVGVTVLEHLGGNKARLAKARRFMGPATLALSGEIERFWENFYATRREQPPS
jgi:hypothetical protein